MEREPIMPEKIKTSGKEILAGIFRKAMELQANEIEMEYKDGYEELFAFHNGFGAGIGRFKSNSEEAEMLQKYLYAAKKPMTFIDDFDKFQFTVKIYESFGEDCFRIRFKKIA